MSFDMLLKSSCSGCGSTDDLYRRSCKHMTLCLSCGKTMMKNHGKCNDCGVTVKRLIQVIHSPSSTDDDNEVNVSDRGEENEEEEEARKNRLGLNKRGGDDDGEEGPRGGDLDLEDDDIEMGDDREHEEIFTDDDEAVGNDPEEREDLAPEVLLQKLSRNQNLL